MIGVYVKHSCQTIKLGLVDMKLVVEGKVNMEGRHRLKYIKQAVHDIKLWNMPISKEEAQEQHGWKTV